MATNKIKAVTTGSAKSVATPFINPISGIASGIVQNINQAAQETAQASPTDTYSRSTPYTDLAAAYEAKAREAFAQQEAALARQLAASKQGAKANYDSIASQNYINYMKQKNALPEQLKAMGINGGASESAQTRMMNNYAINQGSNESSRASSLSQLQNSYDTNLANLRNALEERILENNLALQQAQIQYDDTLAQREYERQMRAEDIAREEKWKQAEFDFAQQQYKDAQKQAQREWEKLLRDQKLEQFAAGTEQYVTLADIKKIDRAITEIKKKKNWEKDPYLYGRVQALRARRGWIKQYNDDK